MIPSVEPPWSQGIGTTWDFVKGCRPMSRLLLGMRSKSRHQPLTTVPCLEGKGIFVSHESAQRSPLTLIHALAYMQSIPHYRDAFAPSDNLKLEISRASGRPAYVVTGYNIKTLFHQTRRARGCSDRLDFFFRQTGLSVAAPRGSRVPCHKYSATQQLPKSSSVLHHLLVLHPDFASAHT